MRSTPRQDSDDEKRLMRAEARAQRKGKAAEAEERHVHDDPITMVKKRKQMVWPHLKILWQGEDSSSWDSERSKKERKTEEEMGR